jgi:hypothetical protein
LWNRRAEFLKAQAQTLERNPAQHDRAEKAEEEQQR